MYELLDDYMKFLGRNKSENTLKNYRIHLTKFVNWLQDNDYTDYNLSQEIYLDYIDYLKESYKPKSVRTHMSAVYKMSEYLYKKGHSNCLPFFSFKEMEAYLPVIEKHRIVTLSNDQLKQMLELVDGDLYKKALINVLYDSGMRVSEIVRMQHSDIIRTEDGAMVAVHGKGRGGFTKLRYVNLSQNTLLMVDKLHEYNKSSFVFASVRTKAMVSERRIEQIIKEVSESVGLKGITTHIFRKTSATTLLENGMPIEYVSKYLGHDNITTTINHYLDTERTLSDKFVEFYKPIN